MTNITFTSEISAALENLGLIPEISQDLDYVERNIESVNNTLQQIQKELHMQTMLKLSDAGVITAYELRECIDEYRGDII